MRSTIEANPFERCGVKYAHIVRGLVTILFAIYSGRCADEIVGPMRRACSGGLGLAEH